MLPYLIMVRESKLDFNTAIITYPSDYDGLLTIGTIVNYYKKLINKSTKLVVAREDPDDEIQRIHFHLYWDDIKRKHVTTNYYDIPLPEPVYVFIYKDKTRSYQLSSDLNSKLGIDNNEEIVPKLRSYVEQYNLKLLEEEGQNESLKEIESWDLLHKAHPNLQLKKEYGDKYFMLRYVVKQKLICRSNFDVNEELQYLVKNAHELTLKANELIEQELLQEIGVRTIDELIDLLKKYKLKLVKKESRDKKKKNRSMSKGQMDKCMDEIEQQIYEFRMFLREKILEKRLTKKEVIDEITKDEKWWPIYCASYINYSKLITDMFRGKPPAKPTKHYEYTYWVPNKLYDYLVWLNQWVENWYTGKALEHRPKGLVLIGPSRIGKTTLISCMGDFSYFKNIWNLDCWEGKTAFTVMDDMDAGDEGKGLSFCWYKPFFGAQDAITVTDKFKPKEDIWNGKPLIWLNNYRIEETFQSSTAQNYIQQNMEIVYLTRPLKEPPTGMDMFQYKEFDPKCTWWYQNVVSQNLEQPQPIKAINFEIIDETAKTIEQCQNQYEEEEPLDQRKKRLLDDKEKGRLDKRSRTQN